MNKPVIIGDATLYLGDCREILPMVPRHDLGIHDPPYGLGENENRNMSRGNLAVPIDYGKFDWDNEPMSADRIELIIAAADKTIIWGGNFFNLPPSSGWLVWDKVNGSNDFADAELAWTNIPKAVRVFRHMWNGMLRDSERGIQRVHPTQKPIALMNWCIAYAGKAESILDACMGSGTVGVAAVQSGCRYTGIEREPKYFDIACERIENAQRQQKLFA